ncbi:MAG: GTPase ObgE [Candidatus Omnitrophica bacterium]|nr:GTPase ObgE [Candidatus Omnitrophota bacterium]
MFIDKAKISVRAGDGGNGCRSFYRDKYMRQGVPNGGDGGKGGDVIVRVDTHFITLLDFKYNRHFKGAHGVHGLGNQKKGREAQDIIIRVPPGTTVTDIQTGCLLRDLTQPGQELVVARGGKGGLGNRYRREATKGEKGEEKELLFNLKLIAEVGVIGFPNVGKSTLIAAVSNAQPKIAAYPFTTKSPVLGVVRGQKKDFVIADIPGLIEGASQGRGLGDMFLRHVERTKILIHMVDMAGFEGRDPLKDYRAINQELKAYSPAVAKKTQILVANKMDLEGAEVKLASFKKEVKKKIYPISALKRQGLEELIEAVGKKL